MTDLDKIMGNLPKPEEVAAQREQKRAAHVDAVCAGLFATATDITAMMKDKSVEDGPQILLDGVALFAAKLFDGIWQGMGKTPAQARIELEGAVKKALFANRRAMGAHEGSTVQ